MNRQTFMKIHRSYNLNIQKVAEHQSSFFIYNGTELTVGKAHRAEPIQRINII